MGGIEAPSIKALTAADIAQAMELSSEAGWNQLQADWQLFVAHGEVFGIFEGAALAATSAVMPYGETFAWISMVLTRKRCRGRGYGTTLLRHCLDMLEQQNRTALLDATPDGERIYRQLGFEPLFTLHRWQAEPQTTESASITAGAQPPPAKAIELANAAFGAGRTAILQNFTQRAPGGAGVSGNGKACLFARDGRRATQLGPLIAADEADAIPLLEGALQICHGPIFIDLADHATAVVRHVEQRGFSRQRPFLRMARGLKPWPGSVNSTIAIAGPEFG